MKDENFYCNCIGPQDGELHCPCSIATYKQDAAHLRKAKKVAKYRKTRRKKFENHWTLSESWETN